MLTIYFMTSDHRVTLVKADSMLEMHPANIHILLPEQYTHLFAKQRHSSDFQGGYKQFASY